MPIAISQKENAYGSKTKPKSSVSFTKISLKTAMKHCQKLKKLKKQKKRPKLQ